jgi:hypothetical protein
VGAFRWDNKEERTVYRAFLRAVQEQLPEFTMPELSDVEMAFRMHYGSFGLIGYTMKILRGAARIASSHPRKQITTETLAQSYAVNVWAERLDSPNPFFENFDMERAPGVRLPSGTGAIPSAPNRRRVERVELHA